MAKKGEIDRLSALPDCILTTVIFPHLSLIDIFRASVLSRRWRFLWNQTPHLDLSREFFESLLGIGSRRPRPKLELQYINDTIYNILLLHSAPLERFSIHMVIFSYSFELRKGLHVHQWVLLAAQKEVKHMSLRSCSAKMTAPNSLFSCRLLRRLELSNVRFRGIPPGFDGFPFLESCFLSELDCLMDFVPNDLIRLCPLLHKLVLTKCLGVFNLEIEAPNLNSLSIVRCSEVLSLTADCPQLVELEIENCYNLIEFKMNSRLLFHQFLHTSDVQIPKELTMLNSLRKLSVKACPTVSDRDLFTLLGCFGNLEEVQVSTNNWAAWQQFQDDKDMTQEELEGDGAADLAFGEVDSMFPSLKKAYVGISTAMKEEEAIMLTFLLNNAPSLNTITVTLPHCPENIHNKEFIDKVPDLQLLNEKMDIRIEIDDNRIDTTCMNYFEDISDYSGNDLSGSDNDPLNRSLEFLPLNFDDDHDYEWYRSIWNKE